MEKANFALHTLKRRLPYYVFQQFIIRHKDGYRFHVQKPAILFEFSRTPSSFYMLVIIEYAGSIKAIRSKQQIGEFEYRLSLLHSSSQKYCSGMYPIDTSPRQL